MRNKAILFSVSKTHPFSLERWELTGGTFQHNLLKFVDSETGDMLPLGFAKDGLPDVLVREVVRVGSDRRGWPILTDW